MSNKVNITQSSTKIVKIASIGPQGPVGAQGISGSQGPAGSSVDTGSLGDTTISGSLTVSGSSTLTNIGPFSQTGVSTFDGNITLSGSLTVSGSGSVITSGDTGSFVTNSQTGSFVTNSQTGSFLTGNDTGSFVINSQTGSFLTGNDTGSFVTNSQTGSFVINSQTGSFITNSQTSSMTVLSSSFATTSSFISSTFISSSAAASGFGSGGGGGSTIDTGSLGSTTITGSLTISGSGINITSGSITGDGSGLTNISSTSLNSISLGNSTIVGDGASSAASYGTVFGKSATSTGGSNVAIGGFATVRTFGISIGHSTNGGARTVAIGYDAGNGNGEYNVLVGPNAGTNSSGDYNIALGYLAGYDQTTGTGNITIGSGSRGLAGESNQLRIGHGIHGATISASLETGNIILQGDVSSSAASTASFGTYLGDGSQLTGISAGSSIDTGSLGSTTITGSLTVSGSGGATIQSSGSTVFSVIGSEGDLFTVTDNLTTGSLFSVKDISGIPLLDVTANLTIPDVVTIGQSNLVIDSGSLEVVGNTTLTGNISSSAVSTASFGTYIGDGSQLSGISTGSSFPFTGDAQITGSLTISGSFNAFRVNSSNLVLGDGAGFSNTGPRNVFLGQNAGYTNTSGDDNVCIGYAAGYALSTNASDFNVFIGRLAGAGGTSPAARMSDANYNIGIGQEALLYLTSGDNNIGFGFRTLRNISSGEYNLGFGDAALYNTDTGQNNIGIGRSAGNLQTSGTGNITIGSGSQGVAGESNQLRIGNGNTLTTISASLETGDIILKNTTVTNLTASGNISSSGNITALDLNLFGGDIDLKNAGAQSNIKFYCESANAHYTKLQAAPHSAYSGNPTVTLPAYAFDFAAPSFQSDITASGNVSSSAVSTASFGTYLGDGSQLTGISSGGGTPIMIASGSTSASADPGTGIVVNHSGSTAFSVIGDVGTLFSVDDSLTGTLFSANDISGFPVLQADSTGEVYLGKTPQSLYTTAVVSSTTAATTHSLVSLSTSSYDGAFFEYTAISSSNARAGSIMSVWNGANIVSTETTSSQIGSTTDLTAEVIISQSQAQLVVYGANASYKVKTIIKAI